MFIVMLHILVCMENEEKPGILWMKPFDIFQVLDLLMLQSLCEDSAKFQFLGQWNYPNGCLPLMNTSCSFHFPLVRKFLRPPLIQKTQEHVLV